jgi:uncharacterized protein (TIGR02099 family)
LSKTDLRLRFYYRLRWLWPVLAHPLARALGWVVLACWLGFVGLQLGLRYLVLPNVGNYQPEIERLVTEVVGQPVKIGRIEARWHGLNPDLILTDVAVSDRQGQPAVTLSQVEAVLSWQSVVRGRLMLALLAVEGPVLHVRRDPQGHITVAGFETEGESDPALARWLFEQAHIRIRNATVVWEDQLRQAPPLLLEDLQFGLDNRGSRHRFGVSAAPPQDLAARLEVRGEVRGDVGDALDAISAKVFVELDYADLAGWQAWLDYPVHLPQGRGAMRLWGDLAAGEVQLTADLALEELRLRLASHLPELDLNMLRGRLEGRYRPGAWMLSGRKLELLTRDGIRVAPSDFKAEWRQAPGASLVSGNATASFLDLGTLASLAAYLPLDARSRQLMRSHQPLGQVSELRLSWEANGDKLQKYAVRAGFRGLGLQALDYVPGASGLTGMVDANEKGGWLTLDSGKSGLSLPAVFPEPDISFDRLQARTTWAFEPDGTAVIQLEKLEFSGPDAEASAQGVYRLGQDGPGEIDLTADIARGEGTAVWRYMPHAVNKDARDWIRRGIRGGQGGKGKLVLKGKLQDFPFRDPATGTFYVKAKAFGARVDYADGWPAIDGINADMHFGVGMRIEASKGHILGTDLSDVTVELPDFESFEEILLIKGVVQGPTAEFLKFIEQSPVSDRIDQFTEGMKAVGNGRLDLAITLPLRQLDNSTVRGEYQFRNNQLQPLDALPPITQVNGRLRISESTVAVDEMTGRLFGGNLKLRVKSEADRVNIQASGQADIAAVRAHFGWPLMDKLSGTAPWKTEIAIRKRNADFRVESSLVGITSTLPEPLNKLAAQPMPLRFERIAGKAGVDSYRLALGEVARGLYETGAGGESARLALVVGEGEPKLPARGFAVGVQLPRVDADVWRNTVSGLAMPAAAPGKPAEAMIGELSLKTPLMRLYGHDYHQVNIGLRPQADGWQIALNLREAAGDLFWQSANEGSLKGRLKRLVVYPTTGTDEGEVRLINSLPAMDFTVDELFYGEKALGRLDLKARNEGGAWRLDALNLKNPDGALRGSGVWKNIGTHHTRLDFNLQAFDIGKLLTRLGYDDAVRRGRAEMNGALSWEGAMTRIDYPTMSGNLDVHAENGQFNKLEPGIGKLLGLISLQSLPRRLSLDFRDIFSDGLAFDSIDGKLEITKGIMRTREPLRIASPAAQIAMEGQTDLKAETQDLQVVIRPDLGGAAAVGAAALVNPVVGAATLLANTVLQDPLSRIFNYRYHVTGSWSDPKVEKVGVTAPQPALPATALPPVDGKKP